MILDSSAPETPGQQPPDWCLPNDGAPALEFLIVTLPDPISTHLSLYFDRTVEALEAAAQQQCLFLDQYWLPWPVPGGRAPPGDTAQDVRVTAILNTYRGGQPGLMILSAHDKGDGAAAQRCDPRILYVFLVSESPTSGINKVQFDNAVHYAQVLGRDLHPTVPVVGPFFSGSAPSAIAISKSLSPNGATLDFVSGTMTNRTQGDTLADQRTLLAEEFVALRFVGLLCVWSLAAAFVVFGAAIIISFAQMDRDAILSRLNGTVAGKLDLSFYLRAVL